MIFRSTVSRLLIVAIALSCTVGSGFASAGGAETSVRLYRATQDDCRILLFSDYLADDEIERITSLGYDVTGTLDPAQLELVNLLDFHVVVIRWIGAGVISTQQADLESFVSAGGSLFIHNPNSVGTIDYAPPGFEVAIESADWCNYFSADYWTCLVDASHPITSGLTDSDLAGAWSVVESIGAGYSVLTQNCVCLDPSLAVGVFGAGKVVFDTGYFSPTTLVPGSDELVVQLFDFLCDTGDILATDTATWSGVKALYR